MRRYNIEYITGPSTVQEDGREAVERDMSRVTDAVRAYLPDFPEPGMYSADEYDGDQPVVSGAWQEDGDTYFTDFQVRSDEFPRHHSSIHEAGHAVGQYLRETLIPSFGKVYGVLNETEIQAVNELPEDGIEKMDKYAEMRSDLRSGHFAAGFENALRRELGLSTDSIEGYKNYADAEDGCIDRDREYFWEESDEASLEQFLHVAVAEADKRRSAFFELLPGEKTEQINYVEVSEIWVPQ